MKMTVTMLIAAMQASILLGATLPGAITRNPLVRDNPSERLSVGVTYEEIEREVDFDNGPNALLEADSAALYVGYDVLPWLTIFATAGGSQLDGNGIIDTDRKLKASLGVCAYMWEGDVLEPIFMAGRISIKPMAEIARYSSDSEVGDTVWTDASAALLLGYEKFDRYPTSPRGVQTSLALYIGPAVSYVSGEIDTIAGDIDFEQDELFGVMGGVDIFLAPSVSFGVEFSHYGDATIGASLRFHI